MTLSVSLPLYAEFGLLFLAGFFVFYLFDKTLRESYQNFLRVNDPFGLKFWRKNPRFGIFTICLVGFTLARYWSGT